MCKKTFKGPNTQEAQQINHIAKYKMFWIKSLHTLAATGIFQQEMSLQKNF